ncbi:hypothetical protein A2U01_0077779, partial [Trifolium medium]|nr:hypothetical protein [Trifolium medium]
DLVVGSVLGAARRCGRRVAQFRVQVGLLSGGGAQRRSLGATDIYAAASLFSAREGGG